MEGTEVDVVDRISNIWNEVINTSNQFASRGELIQLDTMDVVELKESFQYTTAISMYSLERLVYNPDEGIIDKLINVYSSMHGMNASVFTIIHGDTSGQTEFYIGCRNRGTAQSSGEMLQRSFEGNFPGIRLNAAKKEEVLERLIPCDTYSRKNVVSLSVSPNYRKENYEKNVMSYFQGIDKFIESMKGQEYTAVLLAEPVSSVDADFKKQGYEQILMELSKYSKISVAYNESNSEAISESLSTGVTKNITESIANSVSTNTSKSVGKTRGSGHSAGVGFFGLSSSNTRNRAKTETKTSGTTETDSNTHSESQSTSENSTNGTTSTNSQGVTYTINVENRHIQNIISKLEYELDKLENAESYGLWDAAAYIISEDDKTALMGANSLRSLMMGEESEKARSFVNFWDNSSESFNNGRTSEVLKFIHYGVHPVFRKAICNGDGVLEHYVTPALCVKGDVLPAFLGLPMKSVPGVTVIKMAEFGRNIVTDDCPGSSVRQLSVGEVVYMGKKDNTRVNLSANSLAGHTFVCGAPGSGKSNTVYKMLYELVKFERGTLKDKADDGSEHGKVHFLVIEPAKGEYKYEFARMKDINIFTTKTNECEMLRINPFEFPYEEICVTDHIESVKNVVSACWSLTAAMPAILSNALEQAYVRVGWDLRNSIYIGSGEVKYPGFEDVMAVLPDIINSSSYSAESKGDYIGALVTRVESLLRGTAGNVLCKNCTIPDSVLFDENTIIDLSSVGSSEVRALIMGVLVTKLATYRKVTAKLSNYPLRHVTVLEEAHNLLPRINTQVSSESDNVQGKSVEIISAAIAELRTYGEGFIIVDQTPHNVADAAISNTSTKIIMRLPDEEDVLTSGSSVGLTEEQKRYIPMLPQGHAIIKQGNWLDPLVVLVDRAPTTYRSRRLPIHDYDSLKSFRGEVIGRWIKIARRTKNMTSIPSIEKNNFIEYVDKQFDVAIYQRERCKHMWNIFCDMNNTKREQLLFKFIIEVMDIRNGIVFCKPQLSSIPKNLGAPSGVFLKELNQWNDRMKELIDKYVDADDVLKGEILTLIYQYCYIVKPSKLHSICATAMFSII